MSTARCCVLFTKTASPGRVKTRLHAVLSPRQAAELHQAFLDDLIPRLSLGRFDLRIAWDLARGETMPESSLPVRLQEGRDLGERLHRGLADAAGDYAFVVAVGSDHPELAASTVETAFERLEEGVEVVLGPAEDGGYYLIGARREALVPELFRGIDWGTPSVFAATLERCRNLGLEVAELSAGRDVDEPEDLEQLTRVLRTGELACPATERVLRSWGRL